MHSSRLRGTDFSITYRGQDVSHARFFAGFKSTDRLGLLAPTRFDGLGAVVLVMAYVTAFYDRYREKGVDFFAYPDFFSFQESEPVANYSMFDIWPEHKNVLIGGEQPERAASITDRGVGVLLVPEGRTGEITIEPVGLASARRTIRRCFAYSSSGCAAEADLAVRCKDPDLANWARKVIDSVPGSEPDPKREYWERTIEAGSMPEQKFREIPLDRALAAI